MRFRASVAAAGRRPAPCEVDCPLATGGHHAARADVTHQAGFHEPPYAACDDVGRAARMYPDVTFISYHSGIEARRREGAYDPGTADRGIDPVRRPLTEEAVT